MALSGVTTFTMTRNDCIKASLRVLRELGAGGVPTIEDYVNCNQALNIVLKSWQMRGIPLWKLVEISFPLLPNTAAYPLGLTGGSIVDAGITIVNPGSGGTDGTWVEPVLDTGSGVDGEVEYVIYGGIITSVTVTAEGSNYSSPWVQFTNAAGGFEVTIVPLGRGGARPLKFRDAWIRDDATGQDTSQLQVARQDYNQFGYKAQTGVPNQYWYDPQLDTGVVTVYPVPTTLGRSFHGIVQMPIQDMVTATDNFDLPQEWLQAIKWGLADELSLEYGCPADIRGEVAAKAAKFVDDCFSYSMEESSVYFTVDPTGR